MKPDDQQQMRRLLDAFDETGLVALANKGLVRRAQKDRDAGGIALEETDTHIIVRGPDWTVWMPPDGPQHAKDDTKASGVTRQILTATIFLRDIWHPTDTPAVPQAEAIDESASLLQALLEITLDDLIKWTNKTLVREIVALLKSPPTIEVQTGAGVSLKAIEHDVELRLLPAKKSQSAGKLLERIMSTAPKALLERWVVTIVLAYQIGQGRTIAMPQEITDEPTESLLTRQEALAAVQLLLENMVTTGLAHPSQRMIERLFTLSLSALAVGLPRLSRMVRTLADDVGNILTRDAAADTQTLLDRAAWTWALCQATLQAGPQPPRSLIGAVRTQYDPVGDLRLMGLGAYPWETASGFQGVTVLFWDEASADFRTWSASRPTATPGRFDLDQVYRTETPWPGGGASERLSRSRFLLRGARTNAAGRLSAAAGIQVEEIEPANPCTGDFPRRLFNKWNDLEQYSHSHFPIGMREPNPLDAVVILEPSQWGERFFYEIQQRFCWPLVDSENRVTLLTLPWVGVNETAIAFLEAVKPERDSVRRVVARLVYQGPRRWLEPLALLSTGTAQKDCVLNPAFDQRRISSKQSALLEQLRKKYGRDRVPTALTPDDDWTELTLDYKALENAPSTTRRLFADLESCVVRLAEAGVRQPSELQAQRLRDLAAQAQHAGWSELADTFGRLAASEAFARDLLGTAHSVRLHHFLLEVRLHAIQNGL